MERNEMERPMDKVLSVLGIDPKEAIILASGEAIYKNNIIKYGKGGPHEDMAMVLNTMQHLRFIGENVPLNIWLVYKTGLGEMEYTWHLYKAYEFSNVINDSPWPIELLRLYTAEFSFKKNACGTTDHSYDKLYGDLNSERSIIDQYGGTIRFFKVKIDNDCIGRWFMRYCEAWDDVNKRDIGSYKNFQAAVRYRDELLHPLYLKDYIEPCKELPTKTTMTYIQKNPLIADENYVSDTGLIGKLEKAAALIKNDPIKEKSKEYTDSMEESYKACNEQMKKNRKRDAELVCNDLENAREYASRDAECEFAIANGSTPCQPLNVSKNGSIVRGTPKVKYPPYGAEEKGLIDEREEWVKQANSVSNKELVKRSNPEVFKANVYKGLSNVEKEIVKESRETFERDMAHQWAACCEKEKMNVKGIYSIDSLLKYNDSIELRNILSDMAKLSPEELKKIQAMIESNYTKDLKGRE